MVACNNSCTHLTFNFDNQRGTKTIRTVLIYMYLLNTCFHFFFNLQHPAYFKINVEQYFVNFIQTGKGKFKGVDEKAMVKYRLLMKYMYIKMNACEVFNDYRQKLKPTKVWSVIIQHAVTSGF